ncbi:hypothetical protein MPSEU_000019400 [Mayamaea pseudoterrestris]|nr:hypothetical protein MPSEU_000019400 [Mayamaea pseudoterrestris]
MTTRTLLLCALAIWNTASAFAPSLQRFRPATSSLLRMSDDKAAASTTESAFVPLDGGDDDDISVEAVEDLGRSIGKAKRGKKKDSDSKSSSSKRSTPKVNLAPEEVFYEGPPAITETIVPTLSIITVVGIIPAAAAWARQAWVRYKITSRRIRVTSGIGGKDMAEIVYPDIIEVRTAKRLFGDGDLVAFLRDGAKFEMRNIPEFEDTIEFILKQCDDDVVKLYREKGDVTKPAASQ